MNHIRALEMLIPVLAAAIYEVSRDQPHRAAVQAAENLTAFLEELRRTVQLRGLHIMAQLLVIHANQRTLRGYKPRSGYLC